MTDTQRPTTDTEPTFTPAADVIEAYKDGSGSVVVARAGQPMSWQRAQMLGLVAGDPDTITKLAFTTEHGELLYHTVDSGLSWTTHERLPGETDEQLFARAEGEKAPAPGGVTPKRRRKAKSNAPSS